jgi:hypothetical protein
MNCPYNYLDDGEQYSEWRKECQECFRYNECIMNNDMDEPGDNYPTYEEIHLKLKIFNDRKDMIQKLLKADEPTVSQEEIEDMIIDLGNYNRQCEKKIHE